MTFDPTSPPAPCPSPGTPVLSYARPVTSQAARRRFIVWTGLVVAFVLFDGLMIVDFFGRSGFHEFWPIALPCGAWIAFAFCVLLQTTPPDAKRLLPVTSLLIICGVCGAFGIAMTLAAWHGGNGILIATWAAISIAMLTWHGRHGRSLWWTTLFAWHPAPLLLTRMHGPTQALVYLAIAAIASMIAAASPAAPKFAAVALVVSMIASVMMMAS